MQEEVGFVGTQYNQAVSIFTGESSGVSSSCFASPTSRLRTLTRRLNSRIHCKWKKPPAPSYAQLHGRSSAVIPPDPRPDRRDPQRTHRLEQQDPLVVLVPVLLYDVVRARQIPVARTHVFPVLPFSILRAHPLVTAGDESLIWHRGMLTLGLGCEHFPHPASMTTVHVPLRVWVGGLTPPVCHHVYQIQVIRFFQAIFEASSLCVVCFVQCSLLNREVETETGTTVLTFSVPDPTTSSEPVSDSFYFNVPLLHLQSATITCDVCVPTSS
jgi:hypothetical protein